MKKIISFIKRKILRNKRDRWNHKYALGNWDGLHKEDARFNEVIRLIKKYSKNPAILEIGCGEAVMLLKMKDVSISFFRGIDISDVAIAKAKKAASAHVQFESADMESFQPKEQYDVIVFNESLYYSKTPDKIVKKLLNALTPNGCIIVSAVENKYTGHLWVSLEKLSLTPLEDATVEADGNKWNIKVLKP